VEFSVDRASPRLEKLKARWGSRDIAHLFSIASACRRSPITIDALLLVTRNSTFLRKCPKRFGIVWYAKDLGLLTRDGSG